MDKIFGLYGLIGRYAALIPDSVVLLLCRIAPAVVFFRSGMIKFDDFMKNGFEGTIFLFQYEYRIPATPMEYIAGLMGNEDFEGPVLFPEFMAYMGLAAETIGPILLVLGLFTRLGALVLLGTTIIIQFFVYWGSYPDHLLWAAALVVVLTKGPGALSLDKILMKDKA